MRINLSAKLVLAIVIITLTNTPLFADQLQAIIEWFKIPMGGIPPIGSYELSYFPKVDVKDQDADFRMLTNDFVGLIPIVNDQKKDIALLGTFNYRNIDTKAVLPEYGVSLPSDLYDLDFGPILRYKFANDWIGGIAIMPGSESDKLFHSINEASFRLDAFVLVPSKEKNVWVFYIDYYTNRQYFPEYPIPGVGYWYRAKENLEGFFGLPVFYLKYLPVENLKIEFTYIMITDVHATVSYNFTPSLYIYGGFDWNSDIYERADREKDKDRLFYYEKTLSAGIHWQAMKYLGIEVSAGYCFDRIFYESEKYSEKDDNKIDIKNGPFVSARVGMPF